MSIGEWITVFLVFLVAGGLLLLGFRHSREKGFLLNNAYIYASEEARQKMDKKKYYKQSSVVLYLLGILFVMIGISVFFQNRIILLLEAALITGTIIYAIVSTVQNNKKK